MSIQELSPEELARVFFHYHEVLGLEFGDASHAPHLWDEVSRTEQARMIAAARLALLEIGSAEHKTAEDRTRYFAQPGAAEWGC